MIKRQVFYSFHFKNDSWRAGQVRNIENNIKTPKLNSITICKLDVYKITCFS